MMFHFSFGLLVPILLGPPLILLATRLLSVIPHYIQARKLNLPIYISLFTWQDKIWLLIFPFFLWMEHLPFGLGKGLKFSYFGWTDIDKGKTHVEVGNAFCIVSPNHLEIFCAEPTACLEIFQRWKIWTKPPELYEIFNTFGKNINTVNHQDWQRHRKIASQAFREETYDLVWTESSRQAEQLLCTLERQGHSDLVKLRQDFALVTMHVLSSAVFGHSYDYGAGLQQVEPGHKLSYFASLAFVLENLMFIIVFKGFKAPDWLLPQYLRKLKLSANEYQQYLSEAAEQQHKAGMTKRSGAALVAALVQANEDAKNEEPKTGGLPMHLTDEEVFGNMYMFSLAGYETTSFSLSFTIPHLAIRPDLQDWIQEEIDEVFKSGKTTDYDTAFPKLARCRAVMFETLRHHAATPAMPRLSPSDQPTELYFPSMDRTIVVPPDTYVTTNIPALHNDPRTWGPDVYTFNPRRWITTNPSSTSATRVSATSQIMSSPPTNPFGESLLPEPYPTKSNPNASLFIPWLHGPRVCPGKKFSQVEFVAVVANIFRDWRVTPVSVGGKSADGGLRALEESVEKARFSLTPKLWRPERAGVRWVRRGELKNEV